MSTVSKRTVTTTRHEYAVPSPATGVDLTTAIRMALADMPQSRRHFDDAYFVEARDDEIVIWWPGQNHAESEAPTSG